MSNVSEWISVDGSRYRDEHTRHLRNAIVHTSVSPHDVPMRIRIRFDESRKQYVLDFSYMQEEQTTEVKLDEHAHALMGKSSKRIYCIAIEEAVREQVRQDMDKAFDELGDAAKQRGARTVNYIAARKVFGDYWSQLSDILRRTAIIAR